jgi:hypothetical protein
MRRTLALLTALLAWAGAGPARAHQEISPASVPVGRPAFLMLSAANEKQVDLTSVTMTPPVGQQFGHATRDPAGWTANLTHTRIAWTGGAVRPGRFEQFGFDVEPLGQPGPLTFRVVLGYADGTSAESDVAVTAVVAGESPATAAAPPAPATTVAAAPAPAAEAQEDGDGEDSGRGVATLALIVAVVALAVAVTAAVRNRRPAPEAGVGAEGQEW